MKKSLIIVALLLLISRFGSAQLIDKYGFNIGLSYSNQLCNYKSISIDNSNEDYKIGLSAFLSAEKRISKLFCIRPEIGYIQKGFKSNMVFTDSEGNILEMNQKNVVFHDLAANIGLKISPFNMKFSPYIILGFRGDYMISYKDIIFEEPGSGLKFNTYKSQIEDFNKFNLGGLIEIGIEFNDLTYFEFEFNPSITKSYTSKGLDIKDNCWGIKLGFNINKLKKK